MNSLGHRTATSGLASRIFSVLRKYPDVVAFGCALLSVGPLMAWWAVLVRRNILSMDALVRGQIEQLPFGDERARQLTVLGAHTQRQLFMISGESLLAGILFLVMAAALWMVARQRGREALRMQSLLQLTSHQLKTPIAAMRTLLQSLERGSIPLEAQPEFLVRGVEQCDRLEHLVETILAYQRVMAHSLQRIRAVSSEDLLTGILHHRSAMFPAESIHQSSTEPSTVLADLDAVHVVIENLLDNGRKYGGGTLELSETRRGNRWSLTVADQGRGFDPSDAQRLFEPFERAGTSGVVHGSGLGLYIARRLSRAMGGDLTAQSDGEGKGARFTLELPIESQERGHV